MTDIEPEEDLPPVAHVTLVYQGPVAPHWEMKVRYGDQKMLDDFWTRVNARLLLLPKHDPQFRRNRERVNRDAERELIICDWDLGEDDAETTTTTPVQPVQEETPVDDAAEQAGSTEVDSSEVDADPETEAGATAAAVDAVDPEADADEAETSVAETSVAETSVAETSVAETPEAELAGDQA